MTLALGGIELGARGLAAIGCFDPRVLLVMLVASATLAKLASRPFERTTIKPAGANPLLSWAAVLPIAVGLVAVGLALVAARYIPVWAWDAASYHLPFVNFIVQGGASSRVPADLAYVGTYPHNAEYLFAVFRALQPDDTWLDAAQIPFGIVGACVTTLLARRWGAPRPVACSAGAAWLAAPAVLPSITERVCRCLRGHVSVAVGLLESQKSRSGGYLPVRRVPRATAGEQAEARRCRRPSWSAGSSCGRRRVSAGWSRHWLRRSSSGLPDYVANWNRFANPVGLWR